MGVPEEWYRSAAYQPLTTMRRYLDAMEISRQFVRGQDTPLVLGALGPKMMALGAARGAGAHPFNAPPEHTRRARELLGPKPWICTGQHVCLCSDPARARAAARKALEFYFVTPNYQRHWTSLGYAARDFTDGGSDHLVDALVAWGSEAQIRDRIQQHSDAGATQVIINSINPADPLAGASATGVEGYNFESAPHWELYELLRP